MRYKDLNGHDCRLSLDKKSREEEVRHVITLARFSGKWLLTDHPVRGLEFPGGKREAAETLEEAAVREVFEETGALMRSIDWLGEYEILNGPKFIKAAFFGEVNRLENVPSSETNGRVLLETLTLDERFSFLMKDEGMKALIHAAEDRLKRNC